LPPDPNDFTYAHQIRILEVRAKKEALELEAQKRAREGGRD
jgi:hypothetical protein